MKKNFDMNRRSLLKRSAGAMALAMGGGTHLLSSRAAYRRPWTFPVSNCAPSVYP